MILGRVLALVLAATAPAAEAGTRVRVGLEVLDDEDGRPLRGRRVGLVCHAASVTAEGRHAIDVLRARGVELARLFAPEHGLRGQAGAGAALADGSDPATGVPVVSLYGARTRPAPEHLARLDALVIDLQDAGVRFYTYAGTLILCLEAAAEASLELVVLDRPNPLGGTRLEGPEAEAGSRRSLLSMAPGPLIHGLTLGEMARHVNARLSRPARLTVVTMKGWTRDMAWADTGRPWVPPSPNLRSAEAAIAYPGIGLLEATNVSEGRGTPEPFLLFGAPWLLGESLARAVSAPGFQLEPARFTPRASEAAPQPKYEGRACTGLRVLVREPRSAEPYRLGVSLLLALRRLQPEFRWRDDGAALDRLLGNRHPRAAMERGEDVDAILARDAPAIARFREDRRSALIYRD